MEAKRLIDIKEFAIDSINAIFDKSNPNKLQRLKLRIDNNITLGLNDDHKTIKGSFIVSIAPQPDSGIYQIYLTCSAVFLLADEIENSELTNWTKKCFSLVFPRMAGIIKDITAQSGFSQLELDVNKFQFIE